MERHGPDLEWEAVYLRFCAENQHLVPDILKRIKSCKETSFLLCSNDEIYGANGPEVRTIVGSSEGAK